MKEQLIERAFSTLSVCVVLLAMVCSSATAGAPEGFTSLFNGKDLSGWKGLVGDPKSRAEMSEEQLAAAQKEADELMRAHWRVVDGILEYDGDGNSLCTKTEDRGLSKRFCQKCL